MIFCYSMTAFNDWLKAELKKQGMKPADLARKTGLNSGEISHILKGKRMPLPETLAVVAQALDMPVEEAYRAANFLPPKAENDFLDDLILHLTKQLPTEADKRDVAAYIRLRMRIAKEGEKSYARKGNRKEPAES